MRKLISAALVLFMLGLTAQAQEPAVTWAKPISHTTNPPGKLIRTLKTTEGGFYGVRKVEVRQIAQYWIDKYNENYDLVFSTAIPNSEGVMGNMLQFQSVNALKDGIAVFYWGWEKAASHSYYVIRKIGKDGEISEENIKIDGIRADRILNSGSFSSNISPDFSKLLVLTTFPTSKDKNLEIRLKVLNTDNMQQLWAKDFELDFDSKKGTIEEFLVDNKGNAYVRVKYTKDKVAVNEIYTCDAASQNFKRIPLNITGSGSKISLTVGAAGAKSNNEMLLDANGDVVFVSAYDKNKTLHFLKISSENQSILTQKDIKLTAKNEKGATGNLPDSWTIKGVSFLSDGTCVIVGEETSVTRTAASSSSDIYEYTYKYEWGNINVFAISPNGEYKWNAFIPKFQSSTVKSEYDI